MIKKDSGGPVELTDNNPLSPVDHEGAMVGHQRDLAKVDFLLFDVFDRPRTAAGINIPQDELNGHFKGSGIGHPSLVALFD